MNKKKTFIGVIKLMRPQSVLLMLLFVYIPVVLQSLDYLYSIKQIFPLYLLLTGEIILNDYLDVEKDKINKGHRPLAAQEVNLSLANKLIFAFLGCALVFGIIIYADSITRIILFFLVFGILTLYSIGINQLAKVKAFLTALATDMCLAFIFTFGEFNKKLLIFVIAAFFYISSREILMDIRDYEGDMKCGCRTLAVCLGKNNVFKLACVLMLCSQFAYMPVLFLQNDILTKLLWGISVVVLIITFSMFRRGDSKQQNKIAITLWIPMVLTIPSVFM